MPRPKNTIPNEARKVTMSVDVWAQVDLLLFSQIEGRIPYRANKEFFEAAVTHYLERIKNGEPVNA
jgi:hypothetical protein